VRGVAISYNSPFVGSPFAQVPGKLSQVHGKLRIGYGFPRKDLMPKPVIEKNGPECKSSVTKGDNVSEEGILSPRNFQPLASKCTSE
jgi:hypothetical protein